MDYPHPISTTTIHTNYSTSTSITNNLAHWLHERFSNPPTQSTNLQIVKKTDTQSEFNPSSSQPPLQQPPVYGDQGQLVNYPGNAGQLYTGVPNEQQPQYDQMQAAGYSMSAEYGNYYMPQTAAGQGNYLYAQQSTEFPTNNYDQSGQLSAGLPPLDLHSQGMANAQGLYQPNYPPNYAPQGSPYFQDSPWTDSTSSISQQITPLSAYQPTQPQQPHFSFNQYAQDNPMAGGQMIGNQIPFSQQQPPQPSNQFMQNQVMGQIGAQMGGQLTGQLTGQLSGDQTAAGQMNSQMNSQLNSQMNSQLKSQPYSTTALTEQTPQFGSQQLNMPGVPPSSISNVQNLQNIPPAGQAKAGQQPANKPAMVTSAAAGTIAPPLLNKIKQKMASHGSKMIASFKSSPTSDSSANKATANGSVPDGRKASFCPATQNTLNTEELTAHLTDEEKQILAKVFQKEEEFHRETR